ncbi:MAG: glycyl-radical enzyme activating protein [Candidatus Zhuqueibacterota bacterium]
MQRFSIHDGPGIRTTVFLKGCALSCFWCHNPEGQRRESELKVFPDRCIGCMECVARCPNGAHQVRENLHVFNRERCAGCGLCVEGCSSDAIVLTGRLSSVTEVMGEILRDRLFYETSEGGVTLSGGEPVLQPEFACDILKRCRDEGIHTAIETCGYYRWEEVEPLLPHTDLILMDIKHMNDDRHSQYSGVSNRLILENARRFALTDIPIIFRTPVVPTVNDSAEEIGAIVRFIKQLREERMQRNSAGHAPAMIQYELLPFHRLAADKYRSLGLDYRASHVAPPSPERIAQLAEFARAFGIDVVNQPRG